MKFAPLLLILAACSGNAIEEECVATGATAVPADGAGPVGVNTALVLELDGPVDAVEFAVTDEVGAAIAGDTSISGSTATFTPDGGWPAAETVSWTADFCGNAAAGSFYVGTLDEPLDPATLEGDTFTIDLASATWVSPPGAGVLIGQFFEGVFLLGVNEVVDADMSCILAAGEETSGDSYQQDPCFPTTTFDSVDFSGNPYISLQADVLEFEVQGIAVVVREVDISGGLTEDSFVDGQFAGEVDLREYSDFGIDCATLEQFLGVGCTACTSDGEDFCMLVEAEDVSGNRVGGLSLVENENPDECDPDTGEEDA